MKTILPLLIALVVSTFPTARAADQDVPINPYPRAVKSNVLQTWDFADDTGRWVAESQCSLTTSDGVLRIQSTGTDPYFHTPVNHPGGQVVVELRVRSTHSGTGSVFWTTDQQPHRGEDKRSDFPLPGAGQWSVTRTRFHAAGTLTDLRIDPGTSPGLIEIDWIRLIGEELHPLSVTQVRQEDSVVRFEVTNHNRTPTTFTVGGKEYSLPGEQSLMMSQDIAAEAPLEAVTLTVDCTDWPRIERTVWIVNPDASARWLTRPLGDATLSVARDGSVALIRRDDQLLASLGPIVTINDRAPRLELVEESKTIRFRGADVSVSLTPNGDELEVSIDSELPCAGPVVRAVGGLEQGLFAGLEYLGKGERSSSTLDIETSEHVRFAPDPLKVTMPLMAFVTERTSVALTWEDMSLQPVYATPNFFDGTADHRMTLQGKKMRATLRVSRQPLEESIAWVVGRHGLPELPPAPRTREQQDELCLAALNGPLRTEKGWGHCVQERWERHPFADMASTIWRLTGNIPEFDHYLHDGAHVRNGTIYFVTGQAQGWLEIERRRARSYIERQQPDGSYHYQGKYARGHFEDTASGVCALPAARLLEFAYVTGDAAALQAGLRTLDYMKRFRTPRGAQVWECALHTPDQLASAYLVWAYTRGFELTGNQEYLRQARRWALSGIPFTYQWGSYPIMAYATPPVYGATNWVAPNWMGLPVQWVGSVYAYALTLLAPHEKSVDWNQVARGILICAQQQQYPDGPHKGLLPDSFNLRYQRRQPADINPCALVSLQMALDGEVDFLSVARDGETVVAAPFPVTIREGNAYIKGREGIPYQVIVNGKRIVNVESGGVNVVPLD